jgi:hypothetical protein
VLHVAAYDHRIIIVVGCEQESCEKTKLQYDIHHDDDEETCHDGINIPSHKGKVPDCQQRQNTFLDGTESVSMVATLADSRSIFSLMRLSRNRRLVVVVLGDDDADDVPRGTTTAVGRGAAVDEAVKAAAA